MKKILFVLLLMIGATTVCTAQTLRDGNNSTVGKIERDGTIRDRNNSKIGKIDSDGTVRDRNNSTIGKADGVEPRYAALFFFFSMP